MYINLCYLARYTQSSVKKVRWFMTSHKDEKELWIVIHNGDWVVGLLQIVYISLTRHNNQRSAHMEMQ